ncbi:type VI secretion system Vgr family protein [Roseococcus thiosulfatophilus]|uniref:type VI secretion system Vgr family protein n=1 Tax=Roseococcus thiosulfatophilus TaxID=35813 RepID=UPI001A8E96B8|nr:type VI secretion system tip protein TssI/VgrG [Roseococcus thiosulfatophilus]
MSGALEMTQTSRLLSISTTLGPDALVLRRLSVREAIGAPFALSAEVISTELDLAPSALIGKPVTCTVTAGHVPPRHFHAIVRSFSRLGPYGRGLASYVIEAVPTLWMLSRTGDCRIFQDKSVKDIVGTILGENQVAPVRWGGSVPTTPRGYCVQFNETDLDFAQRLLEEVGCGYFFEHTDSAHTLVIGGANADYPLVPGDPQVIRPDADVMGALTEWRPVSALRPGKMKLDDHDGLNPSRLLEKEAATVLTSPGAAGFEIYQWPGGTAARPDADPAKLGMEGYEAGADLVSASGNDPTLFAGGRVRVLHGLDATSPLTWLLNEVVHEAYDETQLAGDGTAGYSSRLVLMAADRPWRPAAPRPRPPMPGVHSAIVTGAQGEEIHCDEYGRVKVHFLWDRAGPRDDASSCWVRVAQGFAGAWGGSWTLPRVGDEVLVAFVSGDPDRPVIIGSVYNAEQKPIYALPANKTQSGFKTRSSKGGGASNFNELRFEDKKGSEEIHVQAEKDMTLLVKNDRTETIKRHRTETVDGKHTETVKLDRSATITQGNESLLVKMGNMDTKVSMGNQSTLVELGNISTKASLGKIEVEAMQSITLTCGGSKIHMTPMGIELEAMMITVKASLSLETSGVLVTHKANGIMTIQAPLVKIN